MARPLVVHLGASGLVLLDFAKYLVHLDIAKSLNRPSCLWVFWFAWALPGLWIVWAPQSRWFYFDAASHQSTWSAIPKSSSSVGYRVSSGVDTWYRFPDRGWPLGSPVFWFLPGFLRPLGLHEVTYTLHKNDDRIKNTLVQTSNLNVTFCLHRLGAFQHYACNSQILNMFYLVLAKVSENQIPSQPVVSWWFLLPAPFIY